MRRRKTRASSAGPELPSLVDRLPTFQRALETAAADCRAGVIKQSYLPIWETLYQEAHSLKGVSKILRCPDELRTFLFEACDFFVDTLAGELICEEVPAAAERFEALAALLPENYGDGLAWLEDFKKIHAKDISHEERFKRISPDNYYINNFVSKKAREIERLGLKDIKLERALLLEEVSAWSENLRLLLRDPSWGVGILVNYLPLIDKDGSQAIKLHAWVAAGAESTDDLKRHFAPLVM